MYLYFYAAYLMCIMKRVIAIAFHGHPISLNNGCILRNVVK
jgi:hypothetical protein